MKGGEGLDEFEILYQKYFKDIYRYILSMCKDVHLAEEITQETFFKALKSLDNFKFKCSIKSWLFQIAKNTYYSHLKKSKFVCNIVAVDTSINEELDYNIINEESILEVQKEAERLDEPYKEVFSLRTYGELSFSEIGQVFNKSESWARVTYHRAKTKIKKTMEVYIYE